MNMENKNECLYFSEWKPTDLSENEDGTNAYEFD